MILIKNFDETTHVGSFEFLWEIHIHVYIGYGLLPAVGAIQDGNGITDIFDADLVDVNVAMIPGVLDIAEPLLSRP
jgi:hypothetical protein